MCMRIFVAIKSCNFLQLLNTYRRSTHIRSQSRCVELCEFGPPLAFTRILSCWASWQCCENWELTINNKQSLLSRKVTLRGDRRHCLYLLSLAAGVLSKWSKIFASTEVLRIMLTLKERCGTPSKINSAPKVRWISPRIRGIPAETGDIQVKAAKENRSMTFKNGVLSPTKIGIYHGQILFQEGVKNCDLVLQFQMG